MGAFEFYLSFYGLLLGLSVAEVASGLARAVRSRFKREIGVLTPLLALFVLLDITTLWVFGWANREHIVISWAVMFGGLVVAVTYYLAAALIFPSETEDWASLDDHYWTQKRYVLAGIFAANTVVVGFTAYSSALARGDPVWAAWQVAYFVPLIALIVSNGRRANVALLAFLLAYYGANALNVFSSDWGVATGL